MDSTIINEAKINDKAWFLMANGDIVEFEPTITHGTYIMKHMSKFGVTKKQVESWAKAEGGWTEKILGTDAEYGIYFRYVLQHGKAAKMQYTDYNQLFGIEGTADIINKYKQKVYVLMLNNFAEKFNMTVIDSPSNGKNDRHVLIPLPVKTFKLNPSPASLGIKLAAEPILSGVRKMGEVLNEMPYIFDDTMPGGGLDLEWEKIAPMSVLDVTEQLTKILSGLEYTDKYGNTIQLKTFKQKLDFINRMSSNKMVIDFARSRFGLTPLAIKKIAYDIIHSMKK